MNWWKLHLLVLGMGAGGGSGAPADVPVVAAPAPPPIETPVVEAPVLGVKTINNANCPENQVMHQALLLDDNTEINVSACATNALTVTPGCVTYHPDGSWSSVPPENGLCTDGTGRMFPNSEVDLS